MNNTSAHAKHFPIPAHLGEGNLRGMNLEGAVWIIAKDACEALDMDTTKGVSKWLLGLDADEQRLVSRDEILTAELSTVSDTPNRGMIAISESGLYALILRSTKPSAKDSQRWVRKVVLPSIRKTGSYVAGEETFDVSTDAGLAAATAHVLAALQAKTAALQAENARLKPKAAAHEALETGKGSMTVSNAAKALHAKRDNLFAWMVAHNWLTKRTPRQATAYAVRMGYMETKRAMAGNG